MSISLDYIISFLLAIASGAFLAGITSLSPIYFIFGIAIIFYFFRLILNFEIKLNLLISISLFTFFFYIFMQSLIPNTKAPNTLGLVLPYLFFVLLNLTLKKLGIKEILSISFFMILFQIVFFLSDAIWRFSHPTFYATNIYTGETRELSIAYMFKFNSIMYLDANFVGVQACLLFFFVFYLYKENFNLYYIRVILIILFILIILTTSRSAIIVLFLFSFIFSKISFPVILTKKQIKLLSFICFILFVLLYIIYKFISKDASFATKFLIIELAIEFLGNVTLNTILFGVGMGNTFSFIGIGAHNLIVTLLIESGITGLFLFFLNIYLIIKKTKGKALYILIPFFTMGFSVVSLAFPYLMTQLAIIIHLENKKNILQN